MIRKFVVAAAGVAALWAAPASASLICTTTTVGQSGTCSESGITTGLESVATLNGSSLNFDLFNTTFAGVGKTATLTGVTFTITGTETLSGTISNVTEGALSGNASATLAFGFGSTENSALNTALSSLGISDAVESSTVSVPALSTVALTDCPGCGILTRTHLTQTNSITVSDPLSAFEAGSPTQSDLDIGLASFLSVGSSGASGTITASDTNSGNVTIAVTYDYSIAGVPEPMTAALLGVGLAAFGYARRRRAA